MEQNVTRLVDDVGSRDREKSEAAVRTLIILGEAVVPALIEMMQEDPQRFIPNYRRVTKTRQRQESIGTLLRQIGTRASVEGLAGLVGSSNPHARVLASRELAEMRRTLHYLNLYDSVIERLLANLETADDRPTVEAAAFALACIGDDGIVPRLLGAVVDAHKNVQKQMVEGFRAAGGSAAVDSLVHVMRSPDTGEPMRRLAALALKAIGTRQALDAMAE